MYLCPGSSTKVILWKGYWDFEEKGLIGGNVDPCLYMKKCSNGVVYIALYIDYNLVAGNNDATDEAT